MSNPLLNELKEIAKTIRIKNYKNMSKEESLSALDELDNYSDNNLIMLEQKRLEIDF